MSAAERAIARAEFERAERFANRVVTMIGTLQSALHTDTDALSVRRQRAK
jgi:hypothetical protein